MRSSRTECFACLRAGADQRDALVAIARDFSPRLEVHDETTVMVDVSGLQRLIGPPSAIGAELRRVVGERGLEASIAVAATRTAALLVAHGRPGLTIVPPGREAEWLAPLPLDLLQRLVPEHPAPRHLAPRHLAPRHPAPGTSPPAPLETLYRWGVTTLGDLAALPAGDLSARLGQSGVAWQRIARGLDARPLVPSSEPPRFVEGLDLEWPIGGLEPLSFVLARLFDPLCAALEQADAGAVALAVRLRLVTRGDDGHRLVHARRLELPAPMRDARTFRTLLLLDLESHPPSAGIEAVEIEAEPAPGRIVQFSLLERARPSPEQAATLLARLDALMGEGRSGSPVLVDTHRPGAFALHPFDPDGGSRNAKCNMHTAQGDARRLRIEPVVRRFRIPIAARVTRDRGRPVQVAIARHGLSGGRVAQAAGPWRTSGHWWNQSTVVSRQSSVTVDSRSSVDHRSSVGSWNRDEWDVALTDGAYRIYRDRDRDQWFIEGILD